MKKIILGTSFALFVLLGCKKNTSDSIDSAPYNAEDAQQVITKRTCGSYEVLQAQLAADPSLKKRMDAIE